MFTRVYKHLCTFIPHIRCLRVGPRAKSPVKGPQRRRSHGQVLISTTYTVCLCRLQLKCCPRLNRSRKGHRQNLRFSCSSLRNTSRALVIVYRHGPNQFICPRNIRRLQAVADYLRKAAPTRILMCLAQAKSEVIATHHVSNIMLLQPFWMNPPISFARLTWGLSAHTQMARRK